ncbi:cupin-like domain-containing protein [Kistimonas scapharcae]|uniref:Cupin-like domain-containing protein n=1 Tax=Kistimonas scapharcae TaxID=1036133 RepID=A0ABP8V8S0_9GAMM
MQLTIDRIDRRTINYQTFFDNYLKPEKPVILSGEDQYNPSLLEPDFIKAHYQVEEYRREGWFDSPLNKEDPHITIPPFIQKTLYRQDISLRPYPMRVFMQPKGHKTLAHFDGNSLSGFNWQIAGEKRWILVSPNTPLPCAPFAFFALVSLAFKVNPARHDFYDFITRPGDVLYLPRYWFHEVYSLQDKNININWVYTPLMPNRNTIIGRRECELLKLRKVFKPINRIMLDDFDEYGGNGVTIVNNYTKGVHTRTGISRFFKEIVKLPKFILLGNDLKLSARLFSQNNFNIH